MRCARRKLRKRKKSSKLKIINVMIKGIDESGGDKNIAGKCQAAVWMGGLGKVRGGGFRAAAQMTANGF